MGLLFENTMNLERLFADIQTWGLCRLTVIKPDAIFNLSIFTREDGYCFDVTYDPYLTDSKDPLVHSQEVSSIQEALAALSKYYSLLESGYTPTQTQLATNNTMKPRGWFMSIRSDNSGYFHPPHGDAEEFTFMGISYCILSDRQHRYYIPCLDEAGIPTSKQDAHTQAKARIRFILNSH